MYFFGWQLAYVQESPSIEHGGGIYGFSTMEIYLPKEDVFVAVFSNCDCNSPGDLGAKLAAIAIGKPYARKEIPVEKAILQGYAGIYENEKGEQRFITVSENKLYSQRGKNQKFNIKAYEKDKFFFDDAMLTIAFSGNKAGEFSTLTTQSRSGSEVWKKTNKLAIQTEIKLEEKILEMYVGEYEITPVFTFSITKEKDKLFVQATGEEKVEIFATTETKFFLKVNDAQPEFVKDDSGKVTKAILNQGGRETDAKKIK